MSAALIGWCVVSLAAAVAWRPLLLLAARAERRRQNRAE